MNSGLSAGNNGGQNGIHCHRRQSIIYNLTNHIIMNKSTSCFLFILTITCYLATVMVDDKISNDIEMHLRCGQFRRPCGCAGVIQTASPNVACPGLNWKPLPLDVAIEQLLAPYHPGGCQGNRPTGKQTTINKYTYKASRFDDHGNAPVQYRAYCPIEEIQGFTRSHLTPPLGKYCGP